nr:putative reverse transcriptase domain-containing protein [Tanacetum cinerariifolium]
MSEARKRAYAINGEIWYSVVSSKVDQLHSLTCAQIGNSKQDLQILLSGKARFVPQDLLIVVKNDILICSKNKKEHEEHLKAILELLKKEELYAKFSKCEFWIPKVQFLGHVIDSQGIHMDPTKIESIKD